MPGEIEFRREAEQRASGILLSRPVVDELLACAKELGIAVMP